MKKKILAAIAAGLICVSAAGCRNITYQEAVNKTSENNNDFCGGYFTELVKWKDDSVKNYYIVYANDTRVKYFIRDGGYQFGITPLYNIDGTLQIYNGE